MFHILIPKWPAELMYNVVNIYFYPLLNPPELIGSCMLRELLPKAFDAHHETEKKQKKSAKIKKYLLSSNKVCYRNKSEGFFK